VIVYEWFLEKSESSEDIDPLLLVEKEGALDLGVLAPLVVLGLN
jgi:hypothetical protein